VNQAGSTRYKNFNIPAGVSLLYSFISWQLFNIAYSPTFYQTTISTTPYKTNLSASLFPSPLSFNNSRWTTNKNKAQTAALQQLQPFGLGNRSCLGQTLALAIVYLTVARVVTLDGGVREGLRGLEVEEVIAEAKAEVKKRV
jgi:hypothetical protein